MDRISYANISTKELFEVNINEMSETQRLRLKGFLPPGFVVDSASDFPLDEACKVRGRIASYGVLIEWHYGENEDMLYLELTGTDGRVQNGPCLVENLGKILSDLG